MEKNNCGHGFVFEQWRNGGMAIHQFRTKNTGSMINHAVDHLNVFILRVVLRRVVVTGLATGRETSRNNGSVYYDS